MNVEPNKPDLFSKVVRKIIAPLWAWKENSPYLHYLSQLQKNPYRPYDQVRLDQWQRLNRLLNQAYGNTEFYASRLKAAGKAPDTIKDWNDFQDLPLLTKEDIRANKDQMVAKNVPAQKLIPGKTSGSTGISLEFFIDEESRQWKRACTVKYDQWSGWNLGEKIGAVWGNPQHRINWRANLRNLLLERITYLDTLQMDEQDMTRFYHELMKKKPTLLFGHAHSLFLLASFLKKKRLTGVRPRGIISTCMVLHPFEREIIQNVFNCKVTNRYGCEEVSLIACECPEGNMHLNCDTLILEFIRDGKPVQPGEPGAIVITDLTNYGMPFIRYKVGDVGIPSAKTSCPCGCTYPIMDSIEGRVADYVMTPEGKFISGISLTENFALRLPGIKQLQIIQDQMDFLIFRLVQGEHFDESTVLRNLDSLVLERFGNRMKYTVVYVDSIQSEESGKYRFCISNIPNPFSD